jgi:hypothetical protein
MSTIKRIKAILESESWSDDDYERNQHNLPKHKYPIGHTVHHRSLSNAKGAPTSGKIIRHDYRHGGPIYDLDNGHWVYEDDIHRAHK